VERLVISTLKNSKTEMEISPHPLTRFEESLNTKLRAVLRRVTFNLGIG
jgi:hypothetical protein